MPRRKRRPPKLKDQPRLAFARRLAADLKRLGGKPLARAITEAYCQTIIEPGWDPGGEFVISPGKLRKLAKCHRDLTLSLVELEALDAYFGHDLTRLALFEFPSLVQELAQKSAAIIFVPSRFSEEEGPMTNYWDSHAVAEIQRAVNLHGPTVKFDSIYVQRRPEKPGIAHAKWRHPFDEKYPPILICIGSPRASRPTEKALRRMFNRSRMSKRWDNLPFSFVYLNSKDGPASHFVRPLQDLAKTHPDLAAYVKSKKGWGLVTKKKVFLSQAPIKRKPGSNTKELETTIHSYGVIAAQRQGDQLVVVVAGLTGPGSLVAAAGLAMLARNLPQPGDPLEHAVLWAVVEATVNTQQMRDGGPQKLEKLRFAIEPELWDPKLQRPVDRDTDDETKKTTTKKTRRKAKRKVKKKKAAKKNRTARKTPTKTKAKPDKQSGKSATMGGEGT